MRLLGRLTATLRFAVVTAAQNFYRNLAVSLAAVSVMFLILLMLAATLLLTHLSDQVVSFEQDRASAIKIYLVDGTSQAEVAHFSERLKSDPRIKTIAFETKEQAAKDYSQQLGVDGTNALDVLGTNPLPASVNISLYNLDDLSHINDEVKDSPLVDHNARKSATNFDPNAISNLQSVVKYVKWGSAIFGSVLGFISLVIIMVTIRTAVTIRQREIEIMKLVGATDTFVRLPFVIEGVMSGVMAALAAGGAAALLYRPMVSVSRGALLFFPFTYDTAYLGVITVVLIGGGILLGAVGSLLGVRRFLAV